MIPLVFTGKAEGLKKGGILHQNMRTLTIACTPDKIPAKIEIDVTPLDMGDAFHVSDLKLGEGIRALEGAGSTVCSVTAPKAEKVAEAAPAEGAAVAEGAAAAPAAGAAPGGDAAKAAAPATAGAKAPAADDDKGGEKKDK